MPKYRVVSSRHDVRPEIRGEFEANNDELAKVIFDERFKKNKNYDWDRLDLLRIDQEEKTTRIDGRG